jgi:transposase-like protein
MNGVSFSLVEKLICKLNREQCPKCKEYYVVIGCGYSGLKCLSCGFEYSVVDFMGKPSAPQVEGKVTKYMQKVMTQ